MKNFAAFSLLATLIAVALLAGAGGAVYYYKDSISQKVSDVRGTSSEGASDEAPTPKPTSAPAATFAPTAKSTDSIAEITPSSSPLLATNGEPLPQSGPEMNLLAVGVASATAGSGYYWYALKRRLRHEAANIERL